jgi:hypothetical protein
MKKLLVGATALAFGAMAGAATAALADDMQPSWAYGFTSPAPPGTPQAGPNPAQVLDSITQHTLPGSAAPARSRRLTAEREEV